MRVAGLQAACQQLNWKARLQAVKGSSTFATSAFGTTSPYSASNRVGKIHESGQSVTFAHGAFRDYGKGI